MRLTRLGVNAKGFAASSDGAVEVRRSLGCQDLADFGVGVGIVGLEADRLPVDRERLVLFVAVMEYFCQAVMESQALGACGQRRRAEGDAFVFPACAVVHAPPASHLARSRLIRRSAGCRRWASRSNSTV